jgi:hypothetical protein
MSELSNFQKNFLAGSGHVEVFTQKEFDDALVLAKAEIMTVAIDTTKTAIYIEREACADMVREAGHTELSEKILNRIPAQRQ